MINKPSLAEMADKGERDRGHGDRKSGSQADTPKLAGLGVGEPQSSHWRALAGGAVMVGSYSAAGGVVAGCAFALDAR